MRLMKYLSLLLAFATLNASALTENDKQDVVGRNLLPNSGFELGLRGLSASGGTLSKETSSPLSGFASIDWDSNSASQTLTGPAITLKDGTDGLNGAVSCRIRCVSGTCTHKLQAWDGSSVLAESEIVSSTTTSPRTTVGLIMPSSGTLTWRLISVAADEPEARVDDCYVGLSEGFNLFQVDQAQLIGTAYIAPNGSCNWDNTSTTMAAFGTIAACNGPTVVQNPGPGVIQTTDTDLPQFTVNDLPPGRYRVSIAGQGGPVAGNGRPVYTINDGTDSRGQGFGFIGNGSLAQFSIEGYFEYTVSGNRTFSVFGKTDANTNRIYGDHADQPLTFAIERLPLTPEVAARPDVIPAYWSGIHEDDCAWTTTSTTFADFANDASCTFSTRKNTNFGTVATLGASQPGVVFTPKRSGSYLVLVTTHVSNSSTESVSLSLTDGTNVLDQKTNRVSTSNYDNEITLIGVVSAASTSSVTVKLQMRVSGATGQTRAASSTDNAVNWTIIALDQGFPSPLLLNQVASSSTSGVRVASVRITNSGTPTLQREDGNVVSSLTDNGVGDTTVNFVANLFSAPPNCVCSSSLSGGGEVCRQDGDASTSAVSFETRTESTGTLTNADFDFSFICVGAK